jgi:5-methylcytosine-specific restriction endonuclease McrA
MDFLGFGERCLALLQEGSFSASYKYAVLISLMDLCLERSGEDGELPEEVPTSELARKVVELYWPQCGQFGDTGQILRQNNSGQAEIITALLKFRALRPDDPDPPLSRSRHRSPDAFRALLDEVEWKLIEMPLPKLQRFGGSDDRFLYEIGWDDRIRRREAWAPGFRRVIRLRPGVAEHLVRLSGLLRPLLEREWARGVARWNRLEHSSLEEFLFGRERISTEPVRHDLCELQDGRCFYCGRSLGERAVVDHFLPWARHPNNAIENLVAADEGCNGSKKDFLVVGDHVSRWRSRPASALADIAKRREWESAAVRTESVVRTIYLRLPDGAQLWKGPGVFEPAAPPLLRRVFESTAS